MIILPQCIKRMLPPWMNLYAILTMATVLASIVGVSEVMTLTGEVLAPRTGPRLLLPFYGYVLIWFFLYCYPIARWTVRLERKFAVNHDKRHGAMTPISRSFRSRTCTNPSARSKC